MADPGSALTIILIAVFVAALAFGLLFLLGARRKTIKAGEEKEAQETPAPAGYREQPNQAATPPRSQPPVPLIPPASRPQPAGRPYGLQAIIDIMGDGIETGLAGIVNGIFFVSDGFINLFRWIFRIDR